MDANIKKILKKIKDLNLFDTLLILSEAENNTMKKYYGDNWYNHFFNYKHIEFSVNNIRTTKVKKDEIIDKYGNEWYNLHIDTYNTDTSSKTLYNFASVFKEDREKKNKISKQIKNSGTSAALLEEDIDYTLHNINTDQNGGGNGSDNLDVIDMEPYIDQIKNTNNKMFSVSPEIDTQININNNIQLYDKLIETKKKQKGGNKNDDTDEDESEDDNDDNTDDEEEYSSDEDEESEDSTDVSEDEEVKDNNLTDVEQEYELSYNDDDNDISNADILNMDDNIVETTKLINDALSDENIQSISDFDESKNNNVYDTNLKDIFTKTYIFSQFIYKDDTIQMIKHKITCGIKQNTMFGKGIPYIIPSRIYMWSEYSYEKNDGNNIKKIKDQIMLGQKWIKRNELLKVSTEPNDNLRVYEKLAGNLKYLKDDLSKYGSRIKREFDDTNILDEYAQYITNNEIYMIDIYHELGLKYADVNEESLKNLYSVYVKIYYNISQDEFKQIIDSLNQGSQQETNRINNFFKNIKNDLLIENEICKTIDELRLTPNKYVSLFKENNVTQSVIHISLQHINIMKSSKIDLSRIFDNFVVDDTYPYLQFQMGDGKYNYKMNTRSTETDKDAVLAKWFENSPYGISFKVKINLKGDSSNKYISINLNENAQLEYKTQWKEVDQATFDDVKKTYPFIRNLLSKINTENDKIQFTIPTDDKFRYAFINTIQQIELPNDYILNHNDLSDFAVYFFPYIAVVVEPRKRQSKIKIKDDKSKYGSYFRYKRISKYENEARIEHRIIHFLRNYEYVEKLLVLEIAKQFNITDKQALDKILEVKEKFPNLKKSRKILKTMNVIPKYKPPGIDINIQGKLRSKYKMRISGARNKYQLDKIISFMNILLYLYVETYQRKNPDMNPIKNKLKSLTNIARRRNKVDEIVLQEVNVSNIKELTKIDKERLAYKPEKGQAQWTRNCQNSGDKKRQPIPYNDKNIDELLKQGYVYNSTSGDYERSYTKGKKEVTLHAAKLTNNDGSHVYYTCNPETNKEYMYVGFLSKSTNPSGLCLPCCFKKDHYTSKNKEKKDFYMKCVGKFKETGKVNKKLMGEKLYILQDTNKIQEGRFSYLPRYLDIYFNTMLNKSRVIKNHYLMSSKTGYFFKYGSRQDEFPYLNAIASAVDLSIDDIKSKIKQALTSSNTEKNIEIFTYLNNGDIRTQFTTIDNYLYFLNTNIDIDYKTVEDILCIPNIMFDNGMNVIIFEKKIIPNLDVSNETVSNENNDNIVNINSDYALLCKNMENSDMLYDPKRKNIFFIKEETHYYPIFMCIKEENSKSLDLIKAFEYENKQNNIINHISTYFFLNCTQNTPNIIKTDNAKITKQKLDVIQPKLNIIGQVIDKRNKCKYLVLDNKHLIPVKPSGTLLDIKIYDNASLFINTLESTIAHLMDVFNSSNTNNKNKNNKNNKNKS